MIDELENGPWPSFISGIKKLRDTHPDNRINEMTNDLLRQLEHSYETRKGYWKGGTVSVYGYGGGIIPRFSEVGAAFPASKEFHTFLKAPIIISTSLSVRSCRHISYAKKVFSCNSSATGHMPFE